MRWIGRVQTGFEWGKSEGKRQLRKSKRKWDNIKTNFKWLGSVDRISLSIGTCGGLLWKRLWTIVFRRIWGISEQAAELPAFQEKQLLLKKKNSVHVSQNGHVLWKEIITFRCSNHTKQRLCSKNAKFATVKAGGYRQWSPITNLHCDITAKNLCHQESPTCSYNLFSVATTLASLLYVIDCETMTWATASLISRDANGSSARLSPAELQRCRK